MAINRRDFLKATGAMAAGAALDGCAGTRSILGAFHRRPTRWRGFNLTEKFTLRANKPFEERDFALMARWGFNFARLPLDYRCWQGEPRERALKELDQAVELGRQYGVHVNLNLHRAPGFCINPPEEPLNLWKDPQALELCAAEWHMLSERYQGISPDRLSFDLLNEPTRCTITEYVNVSRRLIGAIREADPQRPIMADGHQVGNMPVYGLVDLGVMQSTRGYAPSQISHYKASWAGNSQIPPAWPMKIERKKKDKKTGEEKVTVEVWDKERLAKDKIAPWKELERFGIKIHVGEFGSYQYTPHDVALAWMGDNLALWKEAGWGWSMWNLRGSFGILDSRRQDIKYEDCEGLKLDRKMLELLRES